MFFIKITHLKGLPIFHITNEKRVPLVIGVTLCHIKLGKTITVPLLFSSTVDIFVEIKGIEESEIGNFEIMDVF